MLFNQWRLFKQSPPNGQGFANERSTICEILSILFDEDAQYTAWENEKKRASRSK